MREAILFRMTGGIAQLPKGVCCYRAAVPSSPPATRLSLPRSSVRIHHDPAYGNNDEQRSPDRSQPTQPSKQHRAWHMIDLNRDAAPSHLSRELIRASPTRNQARFFTKQTHFCLPGQSDSAGVLNSPCVYRARRSRLGSGSNHEEVFTGRSPHLEQKGSLKPREVSVKIIVLSSSTTSSLPLAAMS